MNDKPEALSFDEVSDLLAYAAARPSTMDVLARVHGHFMAFPPGHGGVQFGVLLSRPEQVDDVARVRNVPANIDFGLNVQVRIMSGPGRDPVPPVPDRSWVTLEGWLSWWNEPEKPLFCRLVVQGTIPGAYPHGY